MSSEKFNPYREHSIHDLSDEEYNLVNQILSSEDVDNLCKELAAVTNHTSYEWGNTLVCAVTDYVGKTGWV